MIYSPYGGGSGATDWSTSAAYLEGNTFDACGGHPNANDEAAYHYHVSPHPSTEMRPMCPMRPMRGCPACAPCRWPPRACSRSSA